MSSIHSNPQQPHPTRQAPRFIAHLAERRIAAALGRARTGLLQSPDMHVVLCGTGSPLPDRTRVSACTAVIAAGGFFLVDVGPGSWRNVDLGNLPIAGLSAILLTHFHSDHIGDLGEAVMQSWVAGRTRPLDVYGPAGTSRVVEGFRLAYAPDVTYRIDHHGEEHLPRAAAVPAAHEIALGDDPAAAAVVLERNGLRITMFRVDHAPVAPAVGYRFDYRGRAVVISGDTCKSAGVVRHAAGADILIHEALNRDLIGRAAAVAERAGKARLAKLARDTLTYHTSPVEAAEVAKAAGVNHLVLTHLVPGPTNALMRRLFTAGMAERFDGKITVGEDGLEFRLAPRVAAAR